MNIVTMIAELDPYTLDHVNDSIKEGYHSGELCISIPNSDDVLYGWWNLKESATKGYCHIVYKVNEIETLEEEYKKITQESEAE